MRKTILLLLVTLLFPTVAKATVIEFNGDGSVTTYEARDYLASSRHSRKKPPVSISATTQEPKDRFSNFVDASSKKHGVDPNLIHAVIQTESHYQPHALSSKGAQGLMQLMPRTAKQLGVSDPFDPSQNIEAGTKYLAHLLRQYDGNTKLALAAYNAGEGAVEKFDGIPPYSETILYVQKIENLLASDADHKH